MNINGIGTGYPAWHEIKKTQKNGVGTGFYKQDNRCGGDNSRVSGQTSALDTYRTSTASLAYNLRTVY